MRSLFKICVFFVLCFLFIQCEEEEIADILIYILIFSDKLNLNLSEIISKKIEKNEHKYPIKKSYGTSKKYTEF